MKQPLVTIAITAFNGAELISRALESSLNQTYSNLEILVVDDASKDATEAVVKQFRAKDPRITYVRNDTNIGYARSLQKLGELARGEYVQLLGADDWLSKNYIETVLDELDAHPTAACVAAEVVLLGETGGNHFDFLDSYFPRKRLITSAEYVRSAYRTASILPTLTAYALFRKSDFLESIRFMNDAFADPVVNIPTELRDLHIRGFATESLFLLKVIRNYDYCVMTDRTAYIKIEYTVQEKKPYSSKGLDWVSAGRILRWFYFTRLAYERVLEADFREQFRKFRIYFGSEPFVSMAIVFMRRGPKGAFFDDLRREDLKAYYNEYSFSEMIVSVLLLPALFAVRALSFLRRIAGGANKEKVGARSGFFLDDKGFFSTG